MPDPVTRFPRAADGNHWRPAGLQVVAAVGRTPALAQWVSPTPLLRHPDDLLLDAQTVLHRTASDRGYGDDDIALVERVFAEA